MFMVFCFSFQVFLIEANSNELDFFLIFIINRNSNKREKAKTKIFSTKKQFRFIALAIYLVSVIWKGKNTAQDISQSKKYLKKTKKKQTKPK